MLLSIHPQELKLIRQRDTCTSLFIAAQFTVPKVRDPPKCTSADVWVGNIQYIYTVVYSLALKRGSPVIVTMWMNMGDIRLREMSRT